MKRLVLPVVALLALGALSACSRVDPPAAVVNGTEISADELETILDSLDELQQPDPLITKPGVRDAESVRRVLGAMIRTSLWKEGTPEGRALTDADRAELATLIKADFQDLDKADPALRTLIIDSTAAADSLSSAPDLAAVLLSEADVSVDPAYGRWDASGEVFALG